MQDQFDRGFYRRTVSRKSRRPLTGYSLDLKLHGRADGTYNLRDHVGGLHALQCDDFADAIGAFTAALVRTHEAQFGKTMPTTSSEGGAPMPSQIVRRTIHKKTGEQQTGFSLYLQIHACPDGMYKLRDHNTDVPGNVRFTDLADFLGQVVPALVRTHDEFYAAKAPATAAL
jgi:hypothetical protein